MFAQPIIRRTLHDEVVDRMRDMIIEGELAGGDRINESELCLRLGVSRTPVREAIKTLASEGLIEAVRAKGAVVRQLEIAEVCDLLEAVLMIEQFACRAAVVRASDTEIRDMVALHDEMAALYAVRDRLAYFKLNQAIHSGIVALAHNTSLSSMHETLQRRLRRIRFVGNERAEAWAGAMAEHDAIIAALRARSGDALAIALGTHLAETRVRVIAHLELEAAAQNKIA